MFTRRKSKILLIIVCAVVFLIISMVFISIWVFSVAFQGFGEVASTEWITPLSRNGIERQGHFHIPASARDVKIYIEDSLNDRFIYVSFKIAPVELESFLDTTSIGNLTVSQPPSMFHTLPRELKWAIDLEKEYLSGKGEQIRQEIVINSDNIEYIIYLVVFL